MCRADVNRRKGNELYRQGRYKDAAATFEVSLISLSIH